ncbi:hypothetical protein BASA62_005398 [Batrachochytrium salamandrivorans]|nr:hypothetical protein BASA62_005398 [Batrachochytrium salamandrivorans]
MTPGVDTCAIRKHIIVFLEARSLPTCIKLQKDSAPLTSLERRSRFKGYSGGNRGGSHSNESTFALHCHSAAPWQEALNCMKLSSTIDKVGDGVVVCTRI